MKIAKNYLYNLTYQIFCILVPLVTTPYISRVLGAQNIGIYSYTLSVSTYFIVVGSLGFPLYGQREVACYARDLKKRSVVFAEIFWGQTVSLTLVLIAYLVFTLFFVNQHRAIYGAQLVGIIASIANIGWLYQGLEEFKITVIRNFFIKITSVACLFLFVKDRNDLLIYTLIINFANLLGNAIIFFDLKKYVDVEEMRMPSKHIFRHFKPAVILGVPYYITSIYAVLDKTMLGSITGNYAEVGFYEQSQKIVTFAMAIVTSLGAVFMPRLAVELAYGNREKVEAFLNKGLQVSMLLSMPIFTGMLLLGDMVTPWFFGAGYEKTGGLIMIFAPLILIIGISNFLGNQYLVAAKKEKLFTMVILVGVLINLFLNAVLIPNYQSYGAAAATVIAEFVKLLLLCEVAGTVIQKKALFKSLLEYGGYAVVMGIVIYLFRIVAFGNKTFFHTFILSIIGVAAYFLCLLLFRNSRLLGVVDRFKKK